MKEDLQTNLGFFKSLLSNVDQKDVQLMIDNIYSDNFGDKLDIFVLSRHFHRPVFVFKIEIDRVQLQPLKIPIEWSKLTPEAADDINDQPVRFALVAANSRVSLPSHF